MEAAKHQLTNLVVYGETGAGKSSLLNFIINSYSQKFPEFEANDNVYFSTSISHFGVTTKSESKIIGNL